MIQGGSSGLVGGFLSDDAAAQVFDGSVPYVAGQVAPRGQALPVSGGFEALGDGSSAVASGTPSGCWRA